MRITLIPGDYMIDHMGYHICDNRGFAIKVKEKKEIDLSIQLDESYKKIVNCILEHRNKEDLKVGINIENIWLILEKGNDYKKGQLIKLTEYINNNIKLHSVKNTLDICKKTCGQLENNIGYTIPLKNKQQPKKITKTEKIKKMTKEFITVKEENIIFDHENNRYVKKIEDKIIEIEREEAIIYPLYNENGEQIGEYGVPKEETITKEETIKNEFGEDVYEDVLDENGKPIQEPIIPIKYFLKNESNSNVEEIDSSIFDENNNLHFKAAYINVLKF